VILSYEPFDNVNSDKNSKRVTVINYLSNMYNVIIIAFSR